MKMTFDEAEEKVLKYDTWVNRQDFIHTIELLRKEYTPDILLTPNQYIVLKKSHTLDRALKDINVLVHDSDKEEDGYINDDMIIRYFMYPHSVKIVPYKG